MVALARRPRTAHIVSRNMQTLASSSHSPDSESAAPFETLERGELRFFIRPRVGLHLVKTFDDVQRLSVIMRPEDPHLPAREIRIGKKRMPDPRRRERAWAYVARVGESAEIETALRSSRDYETKTRGVRHQHGAIRVASSEYTIALHVGRDPPHTHLFTSGTRYVETVSTDLLSALRLPTQASYIAAVFNPEEKRKAIGSSADDDEEGVPFHEPSILDDAEIDRLEPLKGRRFVPLSPSLVGFEGVEIVLIGDPKRECNAFG
jgi:hypothetical protein